MTNPSGVFGVLMKFDFTAGDRGVVIDDQGNQVDCISGDTEKGERLEYVRDSSGVVVVGKDGYKKRVVRGKITFLREQKDDLPMYPPVWPEEAA